MHIRYETDEQIEIRLRRVLSDADLVWHGGPFSFCEFSGEQLPVQSVEETLAFVRDGEVWSALKPSTHDSQERFAIYSFHFPDGVDNSGFVGWLATHLKRSLGTGVFVICGYNSRRGGIFDYWGIPTDLREEAKALIDELRQEKGIPSPAAQ
jgi:hypothetical protein